MDSSLPATTTYGANFTFQCQTGFKKNGTNGIKDDVVSCLKTGKWDLGGLRCIGA